MNLGRPTLAHVQSSLSELSDISERLSKVATEPVASQASVAALATEIALLIERAVPALLSLQHETEHESADLTDDESAPEAWFSEVTPTTRPPRVADLCFAGTFELRRVRSELATARTHDERMIALERAQRKLRRALRAVLAHATLRDFDAGDEESSGARDRDDLYSARAVRRLYATFRRSLKPPEVATPEAVLTALRYAAGAIATLVSAPDYAYVRASDRALLLGLRDRIFAWSRAGRPQAAGLELLSDVGATADLLRGINRRQELRASDAELVGVLLTTFDDDPHAWLLRLGALVGLDDDLDALIERARSAEDPHAHALRTRERLATVGAKF